MSGYLGSGDLHMDRLTEDGLSTGFVLVGNATQFAITEETETKERISTGRDTYGQALDTASIKKPAKITITLDELNKENLAMALLGEVSVLNQGSGTGVSEVVSAKSGKFLELGKGNLATANLKVEANDGATAVAWIASTAYVVGDFIIPTSANDHYYKCTTAGTSDSSEPTWPTDGSTVTDATVVWTDMGVIEYTLETDYRVNYRVGLLEILAAGAITDGQSLKVTYSHNAISGYTIAGSVLPTIKAKLMLDGKNFADGKSVIVRVDEAVLTPGGEMDFLASDFSTMELSGTLRTQTGKTSPYSVELRD